MVFVGLAVARTRQRGAILMDELDPSPPQLMVRLLLGFISARAIYTAAKLGLADQIDAAGSTESELAGRLDVDRSGLERLLRSLSGLGKLHCDDQGRHFLTKIGERCARYAIQRPQLDAGREIQFPAFGTI